MDGTLGRPGLTEFIAKILVVGLGFFMGPLGISHDEAVNLGGIIAAGITAVVFIVSKMMLKKEAMKQNAAIEIAKAQAPVVTK